MTITTVLILADSERYMFIQGDASDNVPLLMPKMLLLTKFDPGLVVSSVDLITGLPFDKTE
jgi:hypothetical protein